MTAMVQFFCEQRRRNLTILAVLALLSIGAVILSAKLGRPDVTGAHSPELLLPDFTQQKDRITNFRITSGDSTFDLKFLPDKGWVLPQHHSYPASFEQVQNLLEALGTFRTIAPKTAQKDWLARLNLNTGGKGVSIQASDEAGKKIADIIIGKRETLEGASGLTGLYVRKSGNPQSWLVSSKFVPSGYAASWLDKSVPAIAISRIMRVTIEPISGSAFTVARPKPDSAFTLLDTPSDRSLADPVAPNDIGTMLSDFDFDDVMPVQEVDFANAPRAVFQTFDGLTVTVETTRLGSYYWSRVMTEGDSPKSRQEARSMASRVSGWAYRLTAEKGQRFFTTQERLLAPVPIRQ